jgi:hypothetical protein
VTVRVVEMWILLRITHISTTPTAAATVSATPVPLGYLHDRGGLVFDELLAYFSTITIERFNTVWPIFRPSNGLLFD